MDRWAIRAAAHLPHYRFSYQVVEHLPMRIIDIGDQPPPDNRKRCLGAAVEFSSLEFPLGFLDRLTVYYVRAT